VRTLCNLTLNDANAGELARLGALPALVRAIRHDDSVVATYALRTLAYAAPHPACAAALAELGAAARVIQVLARGTGTTGQPPVRRARRAYVHL